MLNLKHSMKALQIIIIVVMMHHVIVGTGLKYADPVVLIFQALCIGLGFCYWEAEEGSAVSS